MGEKKNNGIKIRLHTQKGGTYRVVVMKTTQVKDIVSTIFPNRRHQKEKYLYKGKLLDDYTTVGEYDIKKGDDIYLLETELKNNTEKKEETTVLDVSGEEKEELFPEEFPIWIYTISGKNIKFTLEKRKRY